MRGVAGPPPYASRSGCKLRARSDLKTHTDALRHDVTTINHKKLIQAAFQLFLS